jgi:hypothetical protein
MKTRLILMSFGICLVSGVFAQSKNNSKKIAQKDLPNEVMLTYNTLYPDAILNDLYDTPFYDWNYDYYSPWYNDWYDQSYWNSPYNDFVNYEYVSPENYEIDFTKDGLKSRSLYGSSGKWIETRSEIKDLPSIISDAVKKTEYGQWDKWKVAKHIEKIESPNFKGTHYRVAFKNGTKSHIITFDQSGKIILKKMMEKKK